MKEQGAPRNTASALVPIDSGSRSGCVSTVGTLDMVGNVWEWALAREALDGAYEMNP